MIRKLKSKFILLTLMSLFLLLTVIVTGMNIINYTATLKEVDDILSLLSENRGTFPDPGALPSDGRGGRLPPHMSPELPYESRYFSVLMGEGGERLYADIGRIAAVDSAAAFAYAEQILAEGRERGFADDFRFVVRNEENGTRITFLDCGRRMGAFETFLWASILIALCGFALVSVAVIVLSARIVRPIAESYEKQKRFITDAGHEIKTPLTVIGANVDLLTLELGENECLADIKAQTKRLATLTNDLVYLSRMEEAGADMPMIAFPLSEIVEQASEPFRALALTQEKTLSLDIAPTLSLHGNAKAITQLVTLLLDNAFKYAPTGGEIALSLARQGRAVSLSVFNTTSAPVQRETLVHVFDRFYRADPSRSSETGGHGIGLSVARAIVIAHGGRIAAHSDGESCFRITVSFPM